MSGSAPASSPASCTSHRPGGGLRLASVSRSGRRRDRIDASRTRDMLANGTPPNEVMAELYGKVEGCSHGYGGSMHLYDVERGTWARMPSSVVACRHRRRGARFKMRGEPRVALAFFGDGATNIGTFHESMNLAQLWRSRRLRLREQPLVGVDARVAASADRGPGERARLRDARDHGRRAGRRGRPCRPEALEYARSGPGRSSCSATRSAWTATTSATPRSTATRTSSARPCDTQDPIDEPAGAPGADRRRWDQLDAERTGRRGASSSRRPEPTAPETRWSTSTPDAPDRASLAAGGVGLRGALATLAARRSTGSVFSALVAYGAAHPSGASGTPGCLSSPTANRCATRSCARCATTTTSSSWARTSPRWAARWA